MATWWKWTGRSADVAQLSTTVPEWVWKFLKGTFWPLLALAGTYVWSFFSDLRWEYLLVLSVVVICGLAWASAGFAAALRKTRPATATAGPTTPAATSGFEFLGKTRDGVAMMLSGEHVFEFDSHAYPHYIGLDANDRERIRRSLVETPRRQINQWDLAQVLSGQGAPIRDEPVFSLVRRPPTNHTTEFFTRTQLRLSNSDRTAAKSHTDLWRWYKGGLWSLDAENLLREGARLVEVPPPPPSQSTEASPIMAIVNAQMRSQAETRIVKEQLPEWSQRVWAFLRRYEED